MDVEQEQWKVIPNFPKYSASNLGRIRNDDRETILNGALGKDGYVYIGLPTKLANGTTRSRARLAHTLIAQTWLPNPKNKKTVNHINKIKNDNAVCNLEWATQKEQGQHSVKFDKDNGIPRKVRHNREIWKCDKVTNAKIERYKIITDVLTDLNKPLSMRGTLSRAIRKNEEMFGFKWIYVDAHLNNNSDEVWILYTKYGKRAEYYVSSKGNVRNKNRLLKCNTDAHGYKTIQIATKPKRVHVMVAEKFVDNPKPKEYNIVNHKDGNKTNNVCGNLEWVTDQMNKEHAVETGLIKTKKIVQYSDDGTIIEVFKTCKEAGKKLNIAKTAIWNCCNKITIDPKYKLKYLDETDDLIKKKIDLTTVTEQKDLFYKKVISYDKNNGIIEIYDSCVKCGDSLKIDVRRIRRYCNGEVEMKKNEPIKFKYIADTDDLINKKIDITTIPKKKEKIKQKVVMKCIIQYNDNGDILKSFRSTDEASRQLNMHKSTTKRYCDTGILHADKYKLKYLEDTDDLENKKIGVVTIKPKKIDDRGLKIVNYDTNNKIIGMYDSIRLCSKSLKISKMTIKNYCDGETRFKKHKSVMIKYLADTDDLINKTIDIATIPKVKAK
jgi:hypothetical protein